LFGLPGDPESRYDTRHFGVHLETSANNIAMKLSLPANDVFGGLASAAVAIPLAMGYGMFAFCAAGRKLLRGRRTGGCCNRIRCRDRLCIAR
jgi:hypothetical protein